jgi:electron transport complex protein RnfC
MFLIARKGVKLYHEYYIDITIKNINLPRLVMLPIACEEICCTKIIGDSVIKFECIGIASDNIPIYSPYSGVVKDIQTVYHNNTKSHFMVIETKEDNTPPYPLWEEEGSSFAQGVLNDIKKAAVFDELRNQFLFYTINKEKHYDKILIDCVDDEPYNLSKTATILNYEEEVLKGAKILSKLFNTEDIELLINKNFITAEYFNTKKEGIRKINVKGKYPKLPEIKKYAIKNNALRIGPLACRGIYRAVFYKEPQLSQIVTVWGDGVKNPANFEIPYGILVKDILANAKAFGMIERAVCGGLMTGYSASLESSLQRGDGSVTVVPLKKHHKTNECVNCGRCALVCPYGLAPYYMLRKSRFKGIKRAKQLCAGLCDYCGACAYNCPSRIPLTDIIKNYSEEEN